ncbi:protein ORF93 [Lake sturgeon herpesvirus]|nr:protein ORF93 [Lake sturgeon herpesvirus]
MDGHFALLSAFAKRFSHKRRCCQNNQKPMGFVVIDRPLYDPEWERRCYIFYTGLTAATKGGLSAPVCGRLKPFKGCVTYNAFHYVCLVILECQRLLATKSRWPPVHPLVLQHNPLSNPPPRYVSCVTMAYVCNFWATLLVQKDQSSAGGEAWNKIYAAYEDFILDLV